VGHGRDPERMWSMCALRRGGLGSGGSTDLLLATTLFPDAFESVRLVFVPRPCWSLGMKEAPVPEDSGGTGNLPVSVPREEEWVELVDARELTPVSDLYRGRCGGTVPVTVLPPVEMERCRRIPALGCAGGDCIAGEGDVGKAVAPELVIAWLCPEDSVVALVEGACDQ